MYPSEDILEAARSIRPFLAEQLEAEAAARVDLQLADLLARANAGETVDNLILELLAETDSTREWMFAFLQKQALPESTRESTKGFNPLPGQGSAIAAPKYVCPEGDYIWYRPRVGVEPPLCPTHNVPLV
ncbi:MAG: hypothetical protein KME15_20480 [Drouetiella hepatica Uher 2000/2452]|jgi:hypothetical protein|uniref:Uncharacterized protein n=1 Tax=Drouetiella hepatica Uher 2000/2452 TaxID=904376 RepID=A0A951QFK8_9CYAN|nr:hypothetical protein [Drouetiella hepatica Uher 2000/2452]